MMLEVTSFKIQFKSKTLKTCHNSINCPYLKWQAVCQAHYTLKMTVQFKQSTNYKLKPYLYINKENWA
jgi:hypothetical protein